MPRDLQAASSMLNNGLLQHMLSTSNSDLPALPSAAGSGSGTGDAGCLGLPPGGSNVAAHAAPALPEKGTGKGYGKNKGKDGQKGVNGGYVKTRKVNLVGTYACAQASCVHMHMQKH